MSGPGLAAPARAPQFEDTGTDPQTGLYVAVDGSAPPLRADGGLRTTRAQRRHMPMLIRAHAAVPQPSRAYGSDRRAPAVARTRSAISVAERLPNWG